MKIAVCTPTKNRRWAWEFSRSCMNSQIRQPDLWIVIDNSTHPDDDWCPAKEHPLVSYTRIHEPMTIAALRNLCLDEALNAGADYIVFWDDDDYYPPTRISSGIQALEANPDADIAASSHMYMLLTQENVFMEVGPYGDRHGTAATFTIRRRYAEIHRFDPSKTRGEEPTFTKDWTAKMVQVPAEQTIVVMGHAKNTVNKSEVYELPKKYNGNMINNVNGKMIFRMRWPVQWDLFRRTFSV